MRALREAVAFLTILGRPPERTPPALSDLGRSYWWAAPLVGAAVNAGLAVVCLGIDRVSGAPGVSAACFLLLEHGLNGARRLDGLADLADGLALRFARPEAGIEEAWRAVRSPHSGPGGVGAATLLLLLDWSLLAALLSRGRGAFLLAAVLAGGLSKAAVAFAGGNGRSLGPEGDFAPFFAEAGTFPRPLLATLVAFVLPGLIAASFGLAPAAAARVGLAAGAAAIAGGFVSRLALVRALGRLNGDVIGFSWSLASTGVLMAVALSRWS